MVKKVKECNDVQSPGLGIAEKSTKEGILNEGVQRVGNKVLQSQENQYTCRGVEANDNDGNITLDGTVSSFQSTHTAILNVNEKCEDELLQVEQLQCVAYSDEAVEKGHLPRKFNDDELGIDNDKYAIVEYNSLLDGTNNDHMANKSFISIQSLESEHNDTHDGSLVREATELDTNIITAHESISLCERSISQNELRNSSLSHFSPEEITDTISPAEESGIPADTDENTTQDNQAFLPSTSGHEEVPTVLRFSSRTPSSISQSRKRGRIDTRTQKRRAFSVRKPRYSRRLLSSSRRLQKDEQRVHPEEPHSRLGRIFLVSALVLLLSLIATKQLLISWEAPLTETLQEKILRAASLTYTSSPPS